MLSGAFGHLFTSSHVLDEAVTLTRSRTGRHGDARRVADRILGGGDSPDATELLVVTRDDFGASLDAFDRYRDHTLSFTDATSVALMDAHGIDALLSFDDDFDGVVDRLAPGELEGSSCALPGGTNDTADGLPPARLIGVRG